MNTDYPFFQKGYGARNWNRLARLPFSSELKIDYASEALPVSRTRAAIVEERETQKTPVRAKTFRRIWSLVRHGTELIAGLFAVFYLILALALAGALLFFTFAH
ncbi:MAG TPA: hypothetical protein VF020_05350 [Chthoniobacterales bacterium]